MIVSSWFWYLGLAAVAFGPERFGVDSALSFGRVLLQDAAQTGADVTGASSGQGGGYVLAAYLVAAVLIIGYGLSLWWRMRSARADLAVWQSTDDTGSVGDSGE